MTKTNKSSSIPESYQSQTSQTLSKSDELEIMEKVMERTLKPFLENVGQLLLIRHKTYLTEKEVFLGYGIPVKTLQNKRSKKIGPAFIKDGEKVLYSRKAIEDYLQARNIKVIK